MRWKHKRDTIEEKEEKNKHTITRQFEFDGKQKKWKVKEQQKGEKADESQKADEGQNRETEKRIRETQN